MRWPDKRRELAIGPAGLRADGRLLLAPPLTPGGLAAALAGCRELAGGHWRVVVDDAWVRALQVDLPGGLGRDERQALLALRLRATFEAPPPPAAWVAPRRAALPWPGWRRAASCRLVAALLPEVAAALAAWQLRTAGRAGPVQSHWGATLARVPTTAQGALAVLADGRLSVAAWSAGRWLGWRSFLVRNAGEGEAELRYWLAGLTWPAGERAVWCSGWTPLAGGPAPWLWRELPAAARAGRPAAFALPTAPARPAWPLRHRLLALAALLTGAASWYVAQDDGLPAAPGAIVAALPARPAAAPPEPAAPPAPEPAVAADSVSELVVWPEILGLYEAGGRRRLLYSTAAGAASAGRGALIARRFRVERLDAGQVTLRDTTTGESRQFAIESPGVQP